MSMSAKSASAPMKRVSRACFRCRSRKSKCDLESSGGSPPCKRCLKDGHECVLGTSNRGGARMRKKYTSLTNISPPSSSPLKHEFSTEESPSATAGYTPTVNGAILPSTPLDPIAPSDLTEDDAVSTTDSTLPPVLPTNPSDAWQNLRDLPNHAESQSSRRDDGTYVVNDHGLVVNEAVTSTRGIASYRLVREGRLEISQISALVSHYHQYYHAYLPLVPRSFFDPANLDSLAAENKHLLTAMLTIASKDWIERNSYLHECCSRYMHDLISGIAAGTDCGVEAVEALLLLAEWEPQGLRDRVEAIGKGEEDRSAWMHVGTALRVGNFLGLERTSFRQEVVAEDEGTYSRKRLAWASCYISDRLISLRIGKGFWARGPGPMTGFGSKDFPSLQPSDRGDEDYARIFQANLDLTQLYSNVHDVLYTGLRTSSQMMLRGDYVKHIDDFRTCIAHWHNKWGNLDCSPHLKATLQMSYEYLCLYTNAFAFQAAISQALEKKSEGHDASLREYMRKVFANVGLMPDARFIFESVRAAKGYLIVLNNSVDPVQYLRYMPVRFYLYTIYSAVFLFKARSFGAIKPEEEQQVRLLIQQSVSLLKQASISSQDPGARYSRLLERLWQKPKSSSSHVPTSAPENKWSATSPSSAPLKSAPNYAASTTLSDTSSQMNFSPAEMMPSWLDLPQFGNYVTSDPGLFAPMAANGGLQNPAVSSSTFPPNGAAGGGAFYPNAYGVPSYDMNGNALIF